MGENRKPKLRTVSRTEQPFALNDFPPNFPTELGKHVLALMAARETPAIEGKDWEEIFAKCIGAAWKPSNIGLDDVVLGDTAWGLKSVKNENPFQLKRVRLISGRNSPNYSFGEKISQEEDSNRVGNSVLSIWNERVSEVRKKYRNLRTAVLVKSHSLEKLVVFEFDTIRYDPELYDWKWNKNGNLEGFYRQDQYHAFTWQPHGSQFTIIEAAPGRRLCLTLKRPPTLNRDKILELIEFDPKMVEFSYTHDDQLFRKES
jgi:hypothetical protein